METAFIKILPSARRGTFTSAWSARYVPGKSTFIKRFMDTLVLPNIENDAMHDRAVDELPQSSAGRTIMTTEPKFIPENAVEVQLPDNASFSVRMMTVSAISCRAPWACRRRQAAHGAHPVV